MELERGSLVSLDNKSVLYGEMNQVVSFDLTEERLQILDDEKNIIKVKEEIFEEWTEGVNFDYMSYLLVNSNEIHIVLNMYPGTTVTDFYRKI